MKGWLKVVLVLSLVALVSGVLIGCSSGGSGPEATVQGMFKAMAAKNADKVGSYCTEDIREDVVSTMEASFAILDSIKITNLKTTVASQTDDTAIVDAEWDFEIKAFGETNKDHQSDTIDLVKVDGKWLINTPITE
ncbi:MAG: nuclear transport factor 2 family protein [Chloroflexi bacterium]|jgi:hypothetical protein|nr:nuclear transport factor 2 family protein [Chloroflexota bacterium]